jgi:hypothetical protein
MKKNRALYELFNGLMVPHLVCSITNLCNSSCLACDSGMSLLGNAADAFGFNSMAWSQIHEGGNSCDVSSEKTLEYLKG